jgi:hypothetical protein
MSDDTGWCGYGCQDLLVPAPLLDPRRMSPRPMPTDGLRAAEPQAILYQRHEPYVILLITYV